MLKNGSVIVGGTAMAYVAFGRGDKTLLVLPGLSDGLATVRGKAWLLAPPYRKYLRDYTVCLFSRKDALPEDCSIREMAADQALAMERLGLEHAAVLGVSEGGMIAQYLAIDHPERVDKLILAVTAPWANPTVRETVSGWISMARRGDHRALMRDTAEKMYTEKRLRSYRPLLPLLAAATKPADYARFLTNARAILGFDARGELSTIGCPTLILAGSEDRTVGAEAAAELKRAIAGSELYVYEGLGHGAYEEAKDFYDRVLAFCGR